MPQLTLAALYERGCISCSTIQLAACRGPILEVIVSRMRYIAAEMERPVRFLGLSTALANAVDLADWLAIGPKVTFVFCKPASAKRAPHCSMHALHRS